jgi:hypothetical protein
MPKRYRVGILQPQEKQDGIARVERQHLGGVDEVQAQANCAGKPDWQDAKQPPAFGWISRAWRRLLGRGAP